MRNYLLGFIVLFIGFLSLFVRPVAAQEICFPEQPSIRYCLTDSFAQYWRVNGGLQVFGYPINAAETEYHPERNAAILMQWTERNRLEFHAENPNPYTVLLGRMGAERLAQLGRNPTAEGYETGPQPGCIWFKETGHNVCDQRNGQGFKTFWQRHGLQITGLDAYTRSLMLFGLPLTAATMEPSHSGELIMTQWFERARLEWHPNNPDQFRVLLGLLGSEVRAGVEPLRTSVVTPAVFGIEIVPSMIGSTFIQGKEAHVGWIRYNGIKWSQVEAQQGVRDWSQLSLFESEIPAIQNQGASPLVVVMGTPAWAQKVAGAECGPIKPEALDAFASFMHELVARYHQPPYNVKYWELGNEPDIDPALVAGNSPFGCWGDAQDEYYGGGYYAEMLKRVYPAVKAADPEAQIVVGGFLLECDPHLSSAQTPCRSSRFLEGILRNEGGAVFDMLAYHAYMYWSGERQDWDLNHPGWKHRGGVLLGKLHFMRETLAQYGVSKPIVMNEGGLLCYRSSAGCRIPAFYRAQANYVVRLYSRAWANGLQGVFWYTLNGPGWQEGGLLDENQAPRPAYQSLRFMANLLDGATYTGALGNETLEGYAFRKGATTYQVYWTNDRSQITLTTPPKTRAVYDFLGQAVPFDESGLIISFDPIFIEVES